MKTTTLRLDDETYEELQRHATIAGVSMNTFVAEAIQQRFDSEPIDMERLRAHVARIVKDDAKILDALR